MGLHSYNIFFNDTLLLIDDDEQVCNYADDNILLCTGYSYDFVIEQLLRSVNIDTSWFEINHVDVNSDKFK